MLVSSILDVTVFLPQSMDFSKVIFMKMHTLEQVVKNSILKMFTINISI
jgi:hypothetical protein